MAEIWVMINHDLGWDMIAILVMIYDGYDWIRVGLDSRNLGYD